MWRRRRKRSHTTNGEEKNHYWHVLNKSEDKISLCMHGYIYIYTRRKTYLNWLSLPQYLWVFAFLDGLFVLVVVAEALLSLHSMNLDVELRRSRYQYSSTHSDLMVHWANHRMHLMVYMNTNMDLVLMDRCRNVTCHEFRLKYVT